MPFSESQPWVLPFKQCLGPHVETHRCTNSPITDFNPWSKPAISYVFRLTQLPSSATGSSVNESVDFHSKTASSTFSLSYRKHITLSRHIPMSRSQAIKSLTKVSDRPSPLTVATLLICTSRGLLPFEWLFPQTPVGKLDWWSTRE